MAAIAPVSLEALRSARERIAGTIVRTPLLRLHVEGVAARIFLKPENLQPIGSFKLRGAANLILQASTEQLAEGVWTASAGNMAQGVAWCARSRGLRCTAVVPDTAPATKRAAIERFGARIIPVSFEEWLNVFQTRHYAGMQGLFVHPFSDAAVMAGNGTIGLEILEDLPEVDAIVAPYGGGGLSCGIASAMRCLKPSVKVFASEIDTGAPLAASLTEGMPVEVAYKPSFVDGIGAPRIFPEMWELARNLLAGSLVTTLSEVAAAIRLMIEYDHIVAEGAGATPVAAALAGRAGGGNIVCIVSGGNIDSAKVAKILHGEVP